MEFAEIGDIITLIDPLDEEEDFDVLGYVEFNGKLYSILFPMTFENLDGEVSIFEVQKECDKIIYTGIIEEDLCVEIYKIFREKYKNNYNFVD